MLGLAYGSSSILFETGEHGTVMVCSTLCTRELKAHADQVLQNLAKHKSVCVQNLLRAVGKQSEWDTRL